MPKDSLRGRLLVATPALRDSNFSHSVVLLLEHADEGAVGLVLNRPTEVELSAVLPDWRSLAAAPPVVFAGGPVQRDALIALGRVEEEPVAVEAVLPGVGVVDLGQDAALAAVDVKAVRVFAGYAGWGAGQLESEVESGGWFLVDGHPDDPFAPRPGGLWRAVLQRKGGVYRTIPEDPSLN